MGKSESDPTTYTPPLYAIKHGGDAVAKSVLIIDGCGETCKLLSSVLSDSYKLSFAVTTQAGLTMLTGDIRLIFHDLTPPAADGIDVLGNIKEKYPSIPVIAMTACGTEEICIKVFKVGAWDYLKKPLGEETVLHAVEQLFKVNNASQYSRHLRFSSNRVGESDLRDIPIDKLEGILEVKRTIEENYDEWLTLAEACRIASTNKTYLSQYFRHVTGYSLKEYQSYIKIQKAIEFIHGNDRCISDIASLVGYTDASYFSTVFKKFTGVSPRTFRATYKFFEKNKREIGKL